MITKVEQFTVVGIAARTTNAKEMSGTGVIGPLWQRVMQEGLLDKIPNKVDSNMLAVYTEYESDKDGEYTFLVGVKVSSADHIPDGMVTKTVPAGEYALFTSEKGPVWQVVPAIWAKIWNLPAPEPGSNRAYKADFEVYDHRAADPQNGEVDVYVGIK